MNYVVGDVHGHYDTLEKLYKKIPKNSNIYFVGDIIDRGPKSSQVIDFVKQNSAGCVIGNHEMECIEWFMEYKKDYSILSIKSSKNNWLKQGGYETLASYEIIKISKTKIDIHKNYENGLEKLDKDIKWLLSLPLYIKLNVDINKKPVVITHSCIGSYWAQRGTSIFEDIVLYKRILADTNSPVFNIHGHTPSQKEIGASHICVDTGCYRQNSNFGILSAFCIEEMRWISQKRV